MNRRAYAVALGCCVILTRAVPLWPSGTGPAVELTATALIMGGTNQVLSIGPASPQTLRDFVDEANRYYIEPTGLCGPTECDPVAVYTPEQLRPLTGPADMTFDESVAAGVENLSLCLGGESCTATLAPYTGTAVQRVPDSAYVVQGMSQSSIIASHVKAGLIAQPNDSDVSFVLVSNQGRPNGGVFGRFPGAYVPFLGISFTGATPTDSPRTDPMLTVDVARQYDGWVDFPLNPLNLLADLNALMGAWFLHDKYLYADGPPLLQGYYQDTTYYLGPTTLLPLLIPLSRIPIIGMPLAVALDPPLRVLVETGYNRMINPGQPTPVQLTYLPNPLKTLVDFTVAIPTGWDDAISSITGDPADRPFGTVPQPVYGVGGPPVYAGAVDPYIEPVIPTVPPTAPAAEQVRQSPDRVAISTRSAGRAIVESARGTGNLRGDGTDDDHARNRSGAGERLPHGDLRGSRR